MIRARYSCAEPIAHFVQRIASMNCLRAQASDSNKGDQMGVMSRKSGDSFIITSDRAVGELPSKTVPKKQIVDVFQVWTGSNWSTSPAAAVLFSALDAADDYIRANFDRVMG